MGTNLPRRRPLLLVSNHPGLGDAMALFARLPRADLRVIAADRPLLAALPETARRLFFVSDDASSRRAALRQATRYLRRGGALLTYPGGRIEPDPALWTDAPATLGEWSHSMTLFARQVPRLTILPVIVSGVLSRTVLQHPLTRLRHRPRDREWLAATLQMLVPALNDVTPEIAFRSPIHASALAGDRSIHDTVLAEARRLMDGCQARLRIASCDGVA